LLYDYVASQPVVYLADSIVSLTDTALVAQPGNCRWAFADTPLDIHGRYSTSQATITGLSANHFDISTTSSTSSLLVLCQNYHPSWQLLVDGRPEKVLRVNMAFMGAFVPDGTHTVIFKFVPFRTIQAMWVQLFTLIGLLAAGLFFIRKKRRN
jgi:hypothetical protein